ncbi:MAG: cobalamin-dependent protein [Promethearchaeia archaeon]
MHPLYEQFENYLEAENKQKSVDFILSRLESGELDILTVYNEFLTPALNEPFCHEGEEICIWKEHIRTSIIRTIMECCYPFLMKEIEKKGTKQRNQKVLIACPSDEYHELGARMVSDFFTYVGLSPIFIGANTPREQISSAIDYFKPDIVAVSVTNYYHLVEVRKLIDLIKHQKQFTGKIIVGGNAFKKEPDVYKDLGADALLENFQDIKKLAEEGIQ